MLNALQSLLRSRKFLLAVFAVIQTAVAHLFPGIPPALTEAVNALVLALIAAITVEDAAHKFGAQRRTALVYPESSASANPFIEVERKSKGKG